MLWVGLLAVFSLLFGVWGYLAARSRGRTPLVWALVCAFTFFIGIAIVYSLGDPLQSEHSQDHAAAQHAYEQGGDDRHDHPTQSHQSQLPAPQSPMPVAIVTGENPDDRRWRYLTEYHPRISEAVRRIEPLGHEALDELKSAYLALNDATLLPGILRRLDERFGGAQRGYASLTDFGRPMVGSVVGDEEEPIELHAPGAVNGGGDSIDRGLNGNGANGSRPARLMPPETGSEPPPPAQDYRSLRDSAADAEREQTAWRSSMDKDRTLRADNTTAAMGVASTPLGGSIVSQPAHVERAVQDRPAERSRLTSQINGGATNGAVSQSPARDSPIRTAERREDPAQQRIQPPPPAQVETAPVTRPPEHRTVSPAELVGARYLETFGGLHLFGLTDGRVFVDRHEALSSLELARTYVDGLKPKHAEA